MRAHVLRADEVPCERQRTFKTGKPTGPLVAAAWFNRFCACAAWKAAMLAASGTPAANVPETARKDIQRQAHARAGVYVRSRYVSVVRVPIPA
jgi:hypothetical protein